MHFFLRIYIFLSMNCNNAFLLSFYMPEHLFTDHCPLLLSSLPYVLTAQVCTLRQAFIDKKYYMCTINVHKSSFFSFRYLQGDPQSLHDQLLRRLWADKTCGKSQFISYLVHKCKTKPKVRLYFTLSVRMFAHICESLCALVCTSVTRR